LDEDDALFRGVDAGGQPVRRIPIELGEPVLDRGQKLYNVYCSVCHGPGGEGNGMVVLRGFTRPPSYHIQRLRVAADGHFFQVITSGFGRMPSMAFQVEPQDRWAIVAYVRALQLSQHGDLRDVPTDDLPRLQSATQPAEGGAR